MTNHTETHTQPDTTVLAQGARLIYLMGPSGSGKDTVLRHLAAALLPADRVIIAPRTITRASSSDESNIELSESEFDHVAQAGRFAMQWDAHGLRYGIGQELNDWLIAGKTVIVNGSRHYLAAASQRYPRLHAVEIRVDPALLRARLSQRGRESAESLGQRLQRGQQDYDRPAGTRVSVLHNDGPAIETAARLRHLIKTSTR